MSICFVSYKSRGMTQDVNLIKQQLVDCAREAGFNIDGNLFSWKTLLELLAKNGFYLKNWPHDLQAPGDSGTEKGITGLRAQEQTAVFKALAFLIPGIWWTSMCWLLTMKWACMSMCFILEWDWGSCV